MRAVRRIAVALVAFALALVPAVGFATMRTTQHEMSAGAQEDACLCCDPTSGSAANISIVKCCSAVAILIEPQPLTGTRTVAIADMAAAALTPFARPPTFHRLARSRDLVQVLRSPGATARTSLHSPPIEKQDKRAMSQPNRHAMTRRALLAGAAGAGLAGLLPRGASAKGFKLKATPARVALVSDQPETAVWTYNGTVPGPEIRVRQGDAGAHRGGERLAEDTTVHFHGIRLPNAMDGVPHLTQPPIAPGETFTYEFDVPDAGTYWYHPHVNNAVQLGRGLSGPFIVEERAPIAVDRDIVWMLSDWRLLSDGQIRDDFGNMHDKAHNGRIGDVVTINGRVPRRSPCAVASASGCG